MCCRRSRGVAVVKEERDSGSLRVKTSCARSRGRCGLPRIPVRPTDCITYADDFYSQPSSSIPSYVCHLDSTLVVLEGTVASGTVGARHAQEFLHRGHSTLDSIYTVYIYTAFH